MFQQPLANQCHTISIIRSCELVCLLAGLHIIFCSCGMPLRQRSLLQHRGPKHHTHHLFPEEKWGQHVQKMFSHLQSHPWQISADNRIVCAKYKTFQCCTVQTRLLAQYKVHLCPVLVGPGTVTWSTCIVTSSKKFTGCPSQADRSFFSRVPSFCGEMSIVSKSLLSFFSIQVDPKTKKNNSFHFMVSRHVFPSPGNNDITKSFTSRSGLLPHHCGLYPEIKLIIWLRFNFWHHLMKYLRISTYFMSTFNFLADSQAHPEGKSTILSLAKRRSQTFGESSQQQVFQLSVDHVSSENLTKIGRIWWNALNALFWGI